MSVRFLMFHRLVVALIAFNAFPLTAGVKLTNIPFCLFLTTLGRKVYPRKSN